jgi:hypothetical protein
VTKAAAHQVVDVACARRDLVKLLRANSHEHQLWQVWSDFVELSAIAISNSADLGQRDRREARYLEIIKRYKPEPAARFGQALGALVVALDHEPSDVLGSTFMELELGSKWAGQFFTPFALCRAMAQLQVDEDLKEKVARQGFVTANDPAVGAGATLIAFAMALLEAGINYQRHLHVTAQDIDERAAHMAYVQLSLLGIPGIVVVGDTLRMESRAVWFTPAHILGGWSRRLRGGVDVVSDLPALVAAAAKLDAPANESAPPMGQLAMPFADTGRAA